MHHAAMSQRRADRKEKKRNMIPLILDCGTVYHVCAVEDRV